MSIVCENPGLLKNQKLQIMIKPGDALNVPAEQVAQTEEPAERNERQRQPS
jgi:hypothetical protein